MRLLSRLLDILFPPRDAQMLVREATIETLLPLMRPKERDGCVTLLPYRHPLVRALILEAKFRGNAHAQQLLGQALGMYVKDARVVLVPVPLGARRLRERGYNQVEEIAKRGGAAYSTAILKRARETPAQTELSGKKRRRNVSGAFSASAADPAVSYMIVDDVRTTGATLEDAHRALTEAGARNVRTVALAH